MPTDNHSQGNADGVELMAFTVDQAASLAGLHPQQLIRWDATGFFRPQYANPNRRERYSRLYSFRDLVSLRTLAVLRKRHNISLQALRKVGAELRARYHAPWATLRFYVAGKDVYFDEPEIGARMHGKRPQQTALPFEMELVVQEMRTAASRLRERGLEDHGRTARYRGVMNGQQVIAGTRIPTSTIWDFHQAGYSTEAIIGEYPQLTADDVSAAIAFEEQRRRSHQAG